MSTPILNAKDMRIARQLIAKMNRRIYQIQRRPGPEIPELPPAIEQQPASVQGNFMNADMVVDHLGNGTHATLFGAGGALEDAEATGESRFIWICTTHEETISAPHLFPGLNTDQRITVASGSRHRPILEIGPGVSTDSLFIYDSTTGTDSGTGSWLRFQNFGINRSSGASAAAGQLWNADDGKILPGLEYFDIDFYGDNWTILFDFFNATPDGGAESASIGDIIMDYCHSNDAMTATIKTTTDTNPGGIFVMRKCRWDVLESVSARNVSTDVDPGGGGTEAGLILITENYFKEISDFLWRRNYNVPMIVTDNQIEEFTGDDGCIDIGTTGSIDTSDAVVGDNTMYCSTSGSNAVRVRAGSGIATNIAIMGNTLRGPGDSTAILFEAANQDCAVLNGYRDWDNNVQGAGGGSGGGGSNASVTTTDATVTTLVDIFLALGTVYLISAKVVARRTAGGAADRGAAYLLECAAQNPGGDAVFITGSPLQTVVGESTGAWDAVLDDTPGGGNIRIRVTGEAGVTINWKAEYTIMQVS